MTISIVKYQVRNPDGKCFYNVIP